MPHRLTAHYQVPGTRTHCLVSLCEDDSFTRTRASILKTRITSTDTDGIGLPGHGTFLTPYYIITLLRPISQYTSVHTYTGHVARVPVQYSTVREKV